jgi:hypothetical protein
MVAKLTPKELKECVEELQLLLISIATGGSADNARYKELREALLSSSVSQDIPSFVRICRDTSQFWSFIKAKFGHYEERRQFLWSEFSPVLTKLESIRRVPVSRSLDQILSTPTTEGVHEIWTRAQDRCASDPEGAITLARTLLETVCRHILESDGVTPDENWDLPKLYREVAQQLNLSPSQHTEQVFKQILGSCQQVVESLGALRNKLGDAHGKAQKVKPASRHAELAVNLSGSMSLFLVQTWSSRKLPSSAE